MSKVPVQKGPIDCAVPTQMTMSEMATWREDARQGALRKDGQTLKYHEPRRDTKSSLKGY